MRNVFCIFCTIYVCLEIFTSSYIHCTESDTDGNDDEPSVYTLSDEKRLIKRLLNKYQAAGITGRPVKHTSEKVLVEMSLSLIQILDLDEKNQVLTTSVWLNYRWTDHILKWNPENYSQIQEVRVPYRHIWTPDIVLYNYADERLKEMRDAMVIVQHTGELTWIPPAIFKSSCKIDIKSFPFDEQTCHLKFGSWTYDGNKLDVTFINNEAQVLLSDYTESNEWEVIARPALRNVKSYPCCPEFYPDLTFFLFLRRNAAFFSYILVLPCVLLASLTLVIFWLPPESPAKMVLGMNIFVAFFLLLLLLADSTPQASNSVPYIGYYYCLNMILITLSSFLSVFVINLYFRGDKRNRVPQCLRRICHILNGFCDGKYSCKEGDQNTPMGVVISNLNSTTASQTKNDYSSQLVQTKKSALVNSNNEQQDISNYTGAVTEMKRSKKGKARFAMVEENSGLKTLIVDNYDYDTNTIQKKRYRPNQRHCETQTEADNFNKELNTQQCQQCQCHSKLSKIRSRSLTPSKFNDCDILGNSQQPCTCCQYYYRSYVPSTHCTICSPLPVISASTNPRTLNPRIQSSKHGKHPENCNVCKQHLNALMYKTHTNDYFSINRHSMTNPSIPFDNNSLCSHIRYEYRNGRPALISPYGHNYLDHNELTTNHTNLPIKSSSIIKTISNSFNNPIYTTNSTITNVNSEKALQHLQMTSTLLILMKTIETEVDNIRSIIKLFLLRINKKDEENIIIKEWRMIAIVMDRIFFIFYLIIHLCAAFGLLIPRSSEYNVVEFLREYRLKNYNSTFFENETITINNYQNIITELPNKNNNDNNNKLINLTEINKQSINNPDNEKKSIINNEKLIATNEYKPKYDIINSLDNINNYLSPYQRLVDQQSNTLKQYTDENNIGNIKSDQFKKRNYDHEWKNPNLT
ncbi:unnamed protein product [Schistosoma rodhaini]|uniref:Neurotransmitter-gated ion-channel ligand-binding domain-containing protein n=1 Tax=Schistosoma rodhaini TaxID=6188 RepID=A0AA85ELE9_9TREM|nr:unnamed protein product [Schistosoma rodhaini]